MSSIQRVTRLPEAESLANPPSVLPRVVIAHDFVETYGGAERILAAAGAVFPEAPVWAIAGRRQVAERMGVADRFRTVLPENDVFLRHYRMLAPAYPSIARLRRLPPADVLFTSSYAFAHGFRTSNGAPQVCYCYSPLRFAWSMADDYGARFGAHAWQRHAFGAFVAAMRRADRRAASNVSRYVSESRYVARQILRAYGRDSLVIYPPVDCKLFHPSAASTHDGFFLLCGRLIEPYKRPGVVIEAFRSLPHKLVVAGDGPALSRLKERATPNVEFLGHVSDRELVSLMQRCAATVFPSLDDFGLAPVETMACGRPVLAFEGGGALETVVAGVTGQFFDQPTRDGVIAAVRAFDPDAYDPAAIRTHALKWDTSNFQAAIRKIVVDAAREVPGGRRDLG